MMLSANSRGSDERGPDTAPSGWARIPGTMTPPGWVDAKGRERPARPWPRWAQPWPVEREPFRYTPGQLEVAIGWTPTVHVVQWCGHGREYLPWAADGPFALAEVPGEAR